MIKLLISCIWICAVTSASAYVGTTWRMRQAAPKVAEQAPGKLEPKKTRPINVPMIASGAVQGYIVAQFTYTADTAAIARLSVAPEPFLLDEAFKTFYSDDKLDFQHLERYDLAGVTKTIAGNVNKRLGGEVVKDILVEEFNYVSKDDISK